MSSWELYLHSFSFFFGLVVGSFLNVVIARLPHGRSVVKPRSQCLTCDRRIAWYDNFPILSYLILRGKCRYCKQPISARYPLVEFMTGVLFVAAEVRYGWSASLVIRDWPFLSILIALTFIDLDHRIIPDPLSIGGVLLGLATGWLDPRIGWALSLWGAALGFGLFYILAWSYHKLTGRMGLGGGDVKLLAMLGAFVGPSGVLSAIVISSILGSLIGIGWALIKGKKNLMKVSIPYGPFLVIGGIYCYLFGSDALGELLWLRYTTSM